MSLGLSIWAYVSIILALVAFYFWLRRKRYTRERFAISGLTALVTLTSLLIFAASTNVRPSDFIVAAVLSTKIDNESNNCNNK